MTSASHAEGRQFDPGQVYSHCMFCIYACYRCQCLKLIHSYIDTVNVSRQHTCISGMHIFQLYARGHTPTRRPILVWSSRIGVTKNDLPLMAAEARLHHLLPAGPRRRRVCIRGKMIYRSWPRGPALSPAPPLHHAAGIPPIHLATAL